MSIHSGHRQRLKDRFLKEGLDSFEDLYVLELLLYYCIPWRTGRNLVLLAFSLVFYAWGEPVYIFLMI